MLVKFLALIVRIILKIRYKISFSGLELIKDQKHALFLPNHPAEIDPIILVAHFLKFTRIRPIVVERFFETPPGRFVLNLINAFAIPDMAFDGGFYKRKRTENTIKAINDAIKKGDNLIIYPSGQITNGGLEKIGGNSGVHSILQGAHNAEVFLIKTTGLRGSSFSKAFTGVTPPFFPALLNGIKIAFKNLIFFTPKRNVSIQIVKAPASFPKNGDPLSINHWLEDWYNKDGEEEITLVPYYFWKKELPEIKESEKVFIDVSSVSEKTKEKIINKISQTTKIKKEQLNPQLRFGDDLGLDSLATAELFFWAADEFGMVGVEFNQIDTIGALMVAAHDGHFNSQHEVLLPPMPKAWQNENIPCPDVYGVNNNVSIPEMFINVAKTNPDFPVIGDDLSILTFQKLLLAATLFSKKLKELPNDKIGIMLPASVAATLSVISSMLSGKTPVMINWTVGEKNLVYGTELTGLEHIITSKRFIDRVDGDLSCIFDKFIFLEDLRGEFSLLDKIGAFLISKKSINGLIRCFNIDKIQTDAPSIILFTSGSESNPKGVPLSHRNILSCIKATIDHVKLKNDDIICGFLPPFHSFGLTVSTILPLVGGVRIAYYPNPTESKKIAAACAKWKATLLVGTPTFNKAIIKSAAKEMLQTVRLLVVGAEKCPRELFEMLADFPHIEIIEGYGITECSPVVTANIPGTDGAGVGSPLPNVELLIVDHNTMEPVKDDMGLILISGSSVFNGYLGNIASPFITVDNKKWYNSGDLGYIKDGNLYLTGRLKRFIKIGGEMISLPAIEEVLQERWSAKDGEPNIVVISKDNPDNPQRPLLCLVTTLNITLDDANKVIKDGGMSNLMRLSEITKIDKIPILGTGKVDLQSLTC